MIVLTGCFQSDEQTEESISFITNELFLKENENSSIPITLVDIEDDEVIYTYSNEGVVVVEDLLIKSISIGHTVITASYKSNEEIFSEIEVYVEAIEVIKPVLLPLSDYIKVSGSTSLIFRNNSVVGAARESFNWAVSNEDIAVIDEDLILTGLQSGIVTVTATLKSNPSISSSCEITVATASDDRLLLFADNPFVSVRSGEYANLYIDGVDVSNNSDFRWKSYNNNIAMVTEFGKVVGVKEGTAKIAVFNKDDSSIYGMIHITVKGTSNVDYASRLVQVALNEEGYVQGYNKDTKYGEWYGLNNLDWCAMFVSWSANEAGIYSTIIPQYALVSFGKQEFEKLGTFNYKANYTPQKGDIIFFLSNGASHTGIVTNSDGERVYTIEGNTSRKVAQRSYTLDHSTITGYGSPDYPEFNP